MRFLHDEDEPITITMPCSNAEKAHLWRLPDKQEKAPNYEINNKILVLWPLFHTTDCDGPDPRWGTVVHHGVRSAIWSRSSFFLHTDAIPEGVELKFYIEERCMDVATPIFEQNNININEEVITFDGSRLEGDPRSTIGKKMCSFNDPRFSNYEWVCQADMDLFCSSVNAEPMRFPFFAKLRELEPKVGSIRVDYGEDSLVTREWHLSQSVFGDIDEETARNEWFTRAEQLVDSELLNDYREIEGKIHSVHGSLYLYPTKHIYENYPDRLEWVEKAGQLLQHDEAVFSLYGAQWGLFSVLHSLSIPFSALIKDLKQTREAAISYTNGFYFSHVPDLSHEAIWQRESGIPISDTAIASVFEKRRTGELS